MRDLRHDEPSLFPLIRKYVIRPRQYRKCSSCHSNRGGFTKSATMNTFVSKDQSSPCPGTSLSLRCGPATQARNMRSSSSEKTSYKQSINHKSNVHASPATKNMLHNALYRCFSPFPFPASSTCQTPVQLFKPPRTHGTPPARPLPQQQTQPPSPRR